MKGVVLFADDHVHQSEYAEYELYQLFRNEYVVLSVDNLDHLEHALMSVSSFDVIILDWEFIENDPDFADLPPRNPLPILEKLKLFSKIFIYSNSIIPDDDKGKLKDLFPNRVEFKQKNIKPGQTSELIEEFKKIKQELDDFSGRNRNLNFSVAWSRAINQALQEIFGELSEANHSWLRDLYESSLEENGNAILEVIELLNNLLAEQLVQHRALSEAIKAQAALPKSDPDPDRASARLFQRIYYTKIHNVETPISTGDIFDISEGEYAVLITPECEVYTRNPLTKSLSLKERLDVLIFSKSDLFTEFNKPNVNDSGQKGKFNQNSQSKHILPSFPYLDETKLLPGIINFTTALRTVPNRWLIRKKRRFKLNTPYIQQLRQRFSSSHSRVGVPAVNDSVRVFNIGEIKTLKTEQEALNVNGTGTNQGS